MLAEGGRPQRVAASIRRELGPLIDELAREAGLGIVSITDVDVSPDLRHAVVRVTRLGAGDASGLIGALTEERGRFRSHLARVLRLRRVPDLRFRADDSLEREARLSELLRDDAASDED